MPRAQPVDSVRLGITGRAPLPTLPYAQPFAYVSPYRHWARMIARDSFVENARLHKSLRDRIDIPLSALNWRERSPDSATFRVSLLQAERAQRSWQERISPSGATQATCWQPTWATVIYRGVAIERVTDGAIFWRVYAGGLLDQATLENRLADDLAKYLLGVAPPFPAEQRNPAPPARALMCAAQGFTVSAPQRARPRPHSMPPEPIPPPRRPPLLHSTIHPEP